MKRFLITTAIVAAASSGAIAQSADTGVFSAEREAGTVYASDFIGMRVYATETEIASDAYEGQQTDWMDIGEINDVVMSREGQIESVLVDIGGFLGIGERQVAVRMGEIRFVSDSATDEADDFFLVLNADRAMLEGAPEYGGMDMSDQAAQAVEQAEQATEEVASDAANAVEEGGEELAEGAAATANAIEEGSEELAADVAATGAAVSDAAQDMANTREPIMRDGYATATPEAMTTEALTGARVYDVNDEWIGEVSELILGDDGNITQAVIDVGGFLGIGEKPVALAMDELDILQADTGAEVRVYLPMSEDELEAMPRFEG